MTYYTRLGITDSELCAAIARAIVHDVKVNNLGIHGFPAVASRRTETGFLIELHWQSHVRSFEMSEDEAKGAVALLKRSEQYDAATFDRIQEALAALEFDAVNRVQT